MCGRLLCCPTAGRELYASAMSLGNKHDRMRGRMKVCMYSHGCVCVCVCVTGLNVRLPVISASNSMLRLAAVHGPSLSGTHSLSAALPPRGPQPGTPPRAPSASQAPGGSPLPPSPLRPRSPPPSAAAGATATAAADGGGEDPYTGPIGTEPAQGGAMTEHTADTHGAGDSVGVRTTTTVTHENQGHAQAAQAGATSAEAAGHDAHVAPHAGGAHRSGTGVLKLSVRPVPHKTQNLQQVRVCTLRRRMYACVRAYFPYVCHQAPALM